MQAGVSVLRDSLAEESDGEHRNVANAITTFPGPKTRIAIVASRRSTRASEPESAVPLHLASTRGAGDDLHARCHAERRSPTKRGRDVLWVRGGVEAMGPSRRALP